MTAVVEWININQGFFSAVLSTFTLAISIVAIWISLNLANKQNKITLFDKRFSIQQTIANIAIQCEVFETTDIRKMISDEVNLIHEFNRKFEMYEVSLRNLDAAPHLFKDISSAYITLISSKFLRFRLDLIAFYNSSCEQEKMVLHEQMLNNCKKVMEIQTKIKKSLDAYIDLSRT